MNNNVCCEAKVENRCALLTMSMSGKNLIRKCIGNARSTWIR